MRIALLWLLIGACGGAASADEPAKADVTPGRWQFSPQGEHRPSLQYTLLPPYLDQTEGNAATMYYRALLSLGETARSQNDPQLWEKIQSWAAAPADKFPIEQARETLALFRETLESVEIAARRSYCDWDLPQFELRENLFHITLREFQEARNITRLLMLKSRLEIVEGKFEEAVRTIQTSYASARHVGQPPFLISNLVGLGMVSLTNEQVRAFVFAPDAPNLYWPLTALPRPMIDLRPAMGLEGSSVYFLFPQLLDAKSKTLTSEQWSAELGAFLTKFEKLAGETVGAKKGELEKIKKRVAKENVLGRVVEAKAGLIKMGVPSATVGEMASGQAILLYTAMVFDHFRDDLFKWAYVPTAQSGEQFRKARQAIEEFSDEVEIVPIAAFLLPSMDRAVAAVVRQQVRIDQLRVVEAIRMHAAENNGELPAKLSDITVVPIPDNPLTGDPFKYQRNGETVVLDDWTFEVAK